MQLNAYPCIMKTLLLAASFLFSITSFAQTDSGTYLLHKFEQNIGKETYRVTKSADTIIYTVDFKFVDRGGAVPLKATLKVTSSTEPLQLSSKGKTSRESTINDDIKIIIHIPQIVK